MADEPKTLAEALMLIRSHRMLIRTGDKLLSILKRRVDNQAVRIAELERQLEARTAERDAYDAALDGYITLTDLEVEQFFEETDR